MKYLLAFLAALMAAPAVSAPTGDNTLIYSQADVRHYNLGLGRSVFQNKCTRCHGDGSSDAPQLGSLDDWQQRIDKPLDRLIRNAILGHGKMPAKGDFNDLTNREVAAAVAYVVDQGRRMLARKTGSQGATTGANCEETASTEMDCNTVEVQESMLLQMLWRVSGRRE